MHISPKWWKKAKMYRRFIPATIDADFSRAAAEDMYLHESTGTPIKTKNNGYDIGHKWMGVQIDIWRWSVEHGLLFPCELFEEYGEEWIIKVLNGAECQKEWVYRRKT